MLRGRDIRRYKAEWQGLWLIATFPALGVNIDDYPAVKKHLLTFGKARLEQSGKRLSDGTTSRKKTSNAWYEMQDTCAYHADFGKEKLLWMDMSPEGRFAYSNQELFCNDKGFIMTGSALKYLCAVLNSSLVTWFMETTALTTGMGVLQWKKFAIERLPIPRISTADQHLFTHLVDRILAGCAGQQAALRELQARVDCAVNALYGLNVDEIQAVGSR